ncbi:MAG: hypothetical protein IT203_06290 [Fimbriimonadaceae bacterium]|nr:hypothetical protein [Fimbriimonadaceae bacterium]
MKSWGIAGLIALFACIPIFLSRVSSASLLTDTDTAFLLKIIREKQSPLSWFTSDWPLQNHFYRPISTLSFELDNALYGNDAAGYGSTNALLCCACILLLAWLLRELTDSLPMTVGGTLIFASWHSGFSPTLAAWLAYSTYLIGFLGLFRHGFKFLKWLPAVGAIAFLGAELSGIVPLYGRMVAWLPGRTASVMTVFCLIAMAAYARYERTSATRRDAEPTAMDEPATKSTIQSIATPKAPILLIVLAGLATAIALGSYEQAVMLPAALFGVALSFKLRRYQVRWGWQAMFWGLLIAYFVIRKAYVPSEISGYQAQQFRTGYGIAFSALSYGLPSIQSAYTFIKIYDSVDLLMTTLPYLTLWGIWANLCGLLAAFRHWILGLAGLGLSFIAYLPMAWLNQFEHYHYWPMALRTLFVVVLAWGVWELCVIAVSPPIRQAPPRPSPAPGSLPRR